MSRKLAPRWALLLLIAVAVILPIAICVILAVSTLLTAMDDTPAGHALHYVAWGCGILWAIDLVFLVVMQGLEALIRTDNGDDV